MISIVLNVDTRSENSHNKEMLKGVVDREFIVDGILNKKKLFQGFDAEYIVFVDEHEPLTEHELNKLKEISDTLIIRKHNKKFEDRNDFGAFNDLNYLTALFAARGEYLFHFDGDVAAFSISPEPIQEYLSILDRYKFISYPSIWSPNPVEDSSFHGIYWVSTRFFACKRSSLDFTELIKCQLDYDYWKEKYPRGRLCHWLEHILHDTTDNCVYYPALNFGKFILFTWENYQKGILKELNNYTFEQVKKWIATKDFHYPNNLTI